MTERKAVTPLDLAETLHRSIQQVAQLTPAQLAERIAAGWWIMDANFSPGAQGFVLIMGPPSSYAELVQTLIRAVPVGTLAGQVSAAIYPWSLKVAAAEVARNPGLLESGTRAATQELMKAALEATTPPEGSPRQ